MSDQVNYGIIGDVSNVQNIAVGSNVRIDVTNIQPALAEKLDALAHAVRDYHGPEDTREELLSAHEDVTRQLQQSEPDKSRILHTLSTIAGAAGSAVPIITAASALAGAVQAIL
jgi:hypothetical protein